MGTISQPNSSGHFWIESHNLLGEGRWSQFIAGKHGVHYALENKEAHLSINGHDIHLMTWTSYTGQSRLNSVIKARLPGKICHSLHLNSY